MGGIHAVEHASIALFPLFALCDRNDVGGICYPVHPQLEKPAIFIYDGYPGGVGLADYGYGIIEELLRKTLSLIRDCPCLDGCPSCVHSPKCGSGNKPLDKRAAEFVLEWLLGEPGRKEKKPGHRRSARPVARAAVAAPGDSEPAEAGKPRLWLRHPPGSRKRFAATAFCSWTSRPSGARKRSAAGTTNI